MIDRSLTTRRWTCVVAQAPLFVMPVLLLVCSLGSCVSDAGPAENGPGASRLPALRLREALAIAEELRGREGGVPLAWRIQSAQREDSSWLIVYQGGVVIDLERNIVGRPPHAMIFVFDDGRTRLVPGE